ncbi:MAG: DNA adenine methylase, partial [Gammaproteobacteria bacterium]|nr:DNA adenine methylase [Gammaproteobacteria bacterium]
MAKPIIPWMGGKSRLAKHILPLFPDHKCYVELFAGGAALFYKKEPVKVEVLNDLNGELVNLYRVAKHHLEEFVHQFNFALASRQMYEWEKMKVPETLTDIQRAARFYYLQKLAFGGKVSGQTYGTATTAPPKLRLADVGAELSESWQRLINTNIEHLDWQKCFTKYDRPHTFIYMDPPYWNTAGYGVDFGMEQYEKMAMLMSAMKGKAIVSINDHPDMRQVFHNFRIKSVPVTYSVGGGNKQVKRKELIIRS